MTRSLFISAVMYLEIFLYLVFIFPSTLNDLTDALKELDEDCDESDMSTDSEEDEMYYRSVKQHTNHHIYISNK